MQVHNPGHQLFSFVIYHFSFIFKSFWLWTKKRMLLRIFRPVFLLHSAFQSAPLDMILRVPRRSFRLEKSGSAKLDFFFLVWAKWFCQVGVSRTTFLPPSKSHLKVQIKKLTGYLLCVENAGCSNRMHAPTTFCKVWPTFRPPHYGPEWRIL